MENIGWQSYRDIPNVYTLYYTKKLHSHKNITTNLNRNGCWDITEAVEKIWIQIFQNSNFSLKAQILSLVFYEMTDWLTLFFTKWLLNTHNYSLSVVLSRKNGIPWKQWLVQFAIKTTIQVLFLKTTTPICVLWLHFTQG